jgi:hypothetical protein
VLGLIALDERESVARSDSDGGLSCFLVRCHWRRRLLGEGLELVTRVCYPLVRRLAFSQTR